MAKGGNRARKAAGALRTTVKRKRRLRRTVHFKAQLPKLKRQSREPKYQRKAVEKTSVRDALSLLKYPLTTDHAMKKIEDENTLVFIVDKSANKGSIRAAVKDQYDIQISKINTLIRPDGLKKAYVKLSADFDALDV